MPIDIPKMKTKNENKESTMNFNHSVLRNFVLIVIIASLVIGGISGALFGSWASTSSSFSNWIKENIFQQKNVSSVQGSLSSVAGQKNVQVVEESDTIDVVKKVSPAVVSIVGKQDLSKIYNLTGPNSYYFNLFGMPSAPQGLQEVSAGTGFIISTDGLILTNKHVITGSDGTQYTVITSDDKQYDAKIIATDPTNDIALIKIDASNLQSVTLGDSDTLQAGQTVIAIGYALGEYQNTVTKGVVSGLARTITAGSSSSGQSETLENIIQTDAAINFGNSGGPLLNLEGQVVGINTAINQEGQLVSFAIPINQAKKDIDSVQKSGKIVRPYLGVRYTLINDTVAQQNKLSVNYGALIVKGSQPTDVAVVPGSPADKAGIVENDIILEFNGQKIDENHSLASLIQKYNAGDTVTLKILHDGKEKTVNVTLAEYTG